MPDILHVRHERIGLKGWHLLEIGLKGWHLLEKCQETFDPVAPYIAVASPGSAILAKKGKLPVAAWGAQDYFNFISFELFPGVPLVPWGILGGAG